MVYRDNKYYNNMINDIVENTDIEKIDYINWYDDYYIVKDMEYVYLIQDNYNILLKLDLSIIHENTKNYDIVYRDDILVYFNDSYKDGKLVYEYYDIYTYEVIDKVVVGG